MTENLHRYSWSKIPTVDLGVALHTNRSLLCKSSNCLTSFPFVWEDFFLRVWGGVRTLWYKCITFSSVKLCGPMMIFCSFVCMEQSPGSLSKKFFSIWWFPDHHLSLVYLCHKSNLQEVIGQTVNGTTYAGLRARTTGAPQNHW